MSRVAGCVLAIASLLFLADGCSDASTQVGSPPPACTLFGSADARAVLGSTVHRVSGTPVNSCLYTGPGLIRLTTGVTANSRQVRRGLFLQAAVQNAGPKHQMVIDRSSGYWRTISTPVGIGTQVVMTKRSSLVVTEVFGSTSSYTSAIKATKIILSRL
jgi:hypothetical protein